VPRQGEDRRCRSSSLAAYGSGCYRINDEETFVEQVAQHPPFKGCEGLHASGVYILTSAADTPEAEQLQWIAQVLSGTDLNDGRGARKGVLVGRSQP
jgi:hypothetical protein